MRIRLAMGCAVLALFVCTEAFGQSSATIAAKACTLAMSAKAGPDGTTSGWSVQFKRNADNQGATDSSAPYGPRSATVNAGLYTLTAVWTKGGQVTTEQIGTATCQNATVTFVAFVPPPPAEVCGDGLDNDKDGQVDEGCPPPATGSPDGTAIPPATSITDSTGAIWILAEELNGVPGVRYVKRNGQYLGAGNPVYGYELLYSGGSVYLFGADKIWYRWDGSQLVRHGTTRPGGAAPSADAKTESRTLAFVPDKAEYDTIVSRYLLTVTDISGQIAQEVSLGKPALSMAGEVSMPVTLTLVPGQNYSAAVAACDTVTCGPYSVGVGFTF